MASIPALGSPTAESALNELLTFLSNKQNDTTSNPNNVTLVDSFTRDNRTGAISATISLPSTATLDAQGNQTVTITPVFT